MTFVHFWGGGGQAGESSAHVARELAQKLTAWQFTSKLYLVPFEPLQREIVQRAPETFRVLLYRRLMLRIAQQFAFREQALGIISGDSLGQVASQTLHNMAAVEVWRGFRFIVRWPETKNWRLWRWRGRLERTIFLPSRFMIAARCLCRDRPRCLRP